MAQQGGQLSSHSISLPPKEITSVEQEKQLAGAVGMVVCGYRITEPDGTQLEVPVVTGSCFAVSPSGHFLTNRHVLEKTWKDLHADLLWEKLRKEKLTVVQPKIWLFLQHKKHEAEIVHISDVFDVGILKIAAMTPYFALTSQTEVHRGTKVSACGFPAAAKEALLSVDEAFDKIRREITAEKAEDLFKPRDFEFIMTNGTVGRVVTEEKGRVWIYHNATINKGNSGGPLVAEDGRAIAINTAGNTPEGVFASLSLAQLREEVDAKVPDVAWK
jgi:S1-C subfamily serine protease